MPVTRSAHKKLRQDKNRQITNLRVKRKIHSAVKKFKAAPSEKLLSSVYSILDTAKKKKIYHDNKVSRVKSRLTKLLSKKSPPSTKTIRKIKITKKTS